MNWKRSANGNPRLKIGDCWLVIHLGTYGKWGTRLITPNGSINGPWVRGEEAAKRAALALYKKHMGEAPQPNPTQPPSPLHDTKKKETPVTVTAKVIRGKAGQPYAFPRSSVPSVDIYVNLGATRVITRVSYPHQGEVKVHYLVTDRKHLSGMDPKEHDELAGLVHALRWVEQKAKGDVSRIHVRVASAHCPPNTVSLRYTRGVDLLDLSRLKAAVKSFTWLSCTKDMLDESQYLQPALALEESDPFQAAA